MSAFDKWKKDSGIHPHYFGASRAGYLAGLKRAEEICRDVMRKGGPHQAQSCADAIRKEIERENAMP